MPFNNYSTNMRWIWSDRWRTKRETPSCNNHIQDPFFDSRILRRNNSELKLGHSHLHKILCDNCYCFKSSSLFCMPGLFIKCLDLQCLLVITDSGSPSFYCLSNLELNYLIRLGNCFLLLMHIHTKIYSQTEKIREKSVITL